MARRRLEGRRDVSDDHIRTQFRQFADRIDAALRNQQEVSMFMHEGIMDDWVDEQGWLRKRLDGSAVLTVVISPAHALQFTKALQSPDVAEK
jgi:hypothetical protein